MQQIMVCKCTKFFSCLLFIAFSLFFVQNAWAGDANSDTVESHNESSLNNDLSDLPSASNSLIIFKEETDNSGIKKITDDAVSDEQSLKSSEAKGSTTVASKDGSDDSLLNGWISESGHLYYYSNGVLLEGLQILSNNIYYFDPENSGAAVTGWKKIDNKWYYFKPAPSCAAATGWQKINNRWYYLDPNDATMHSGLEKINGKWYYLDPSKDSTAASGWQKIDGSWYLFDQPSSCAALTGWQKVNNKWYYLDLDTSVMLSGRQHIEGTDYYFNESGKLVQDDWVELEGVRTYSNTSGALTYIWNENSLLREVSITDLDGNIQFGWIDCGSSRYYSDLNTGLLLTGTAMIDGKQYHFNEDYSLKTGWNKLQDGNWYYLDKDGLATYGWQKVNSNWYYLSPSDGHMLTGWQKINGKWYYLKPGDSGKMLTGWQKINGKSYYFTSSGVWVDGGKMAIKAQDYSSKTKYLILVDCSAHKVGVFKGSKNNWMLYYSWSCVTGASSTPTIKGSYYTTGFKRGSLSTDSRAIYCTQIWGGYFFHSILASESELGKSLSHGCIRLPYSAAKWIYSNISVGTRVVIYQ